MMLKKKKKSGLWNTLSFLLLVANKLSQKTFHLQPMSDEHSLDSNSDVLAEVSVVLGMAAHSSCYDPNDSSEESVGLNLSLRREGK